MNKQEKEIRQRIFEDVKKIYSLRQENKEPFVPGQSFVHYAGRYFDDSDIINLVDSSLDFWLTAGRYADDFEAEFAGYIGVEECMLVNSGSSANLVAISALTSPQLGERRVKPGDEIITVAAGFPTTVNPIIQVGAVPVFVDVNLGDYTAVVEQVRDAVTPRTKAIFMAHTMGVPFDIDAIMEIASAQDIWVVEDNCDAVGSEYNGRRTGGHGHLGTISFYPAHHITMGEGGAVVTDDETLARLVRSFRDWGRDCYCGPGENNTCGKRFTQQFGQLPFGYDHKYVVAHIGYNLKVTDMQAAIGVAQLERVDEVTEKRRLNHSFLEKRLKPYEDKLILHSALPKSDPSWFGCVLTVKPDAGFSREMLVEFLDMKKIEARSLFMGNVLKHPAYTDIEYRVIGDLENTEQVMRNTFFVGVYPGLTEEMLNYMADSFDEFFKI